MEGVNDASLPCGDVFDDGAVFEVELDGDGAEGLQPSELAGGFNSLEGGGVAALKSGDVGWNREGGIVKGGPEETREDFGVDGWGGKGFSEVFFLLDKAISAGGVEDVF